jgi:cellobiose-specific phosphotransferase system component IIA
MKSYISDILDKWPHLRTGKYEIYAKHITEKDEGIIEAHHVHVGNVLACTAFTKLELTFNIVSTEVWSKLRMFQ